MHTLIYLLLAAIIYGVLADRTDRAVDREMKKRRRGGTGLALVDEFSARPDFAPRYGRRAQSNVRRRRQHDRSTVRRRRA